MEMENEKFKELSDNLLYYRRQNDFKSAAEELARAADKLWVHYHGQTFDADKLIYFQQRPVLLWWALENMRAGRPELAEFFLEKKSTLDDIVPDKYALWDNRYRALISYRLGKYEAAGRMFEQWLQLYPDDEEIQFYLGNVFYHRGELHKAFLEYTRAAKLRHIFPEALVNMALTLKAMGRTEDIGRIPVISSAIKQAIGRKDLVEDIAVPDMQRAEIHRQDIPIFIRAKNCLAGLEKLVTWLQQAGQRDIRILDNGSSYPPLISYYESLKGVPEIKIYRLEKDFGNQVLWRGDFLRDMPPYMPYVYADSDAVPDDGCPTNLLAYLCRVLADYPFLEKAAPALRTDDIVVDEAASIRAEARRQQRISPAEGLYFAPRETKFALYRGTCHHYAVRLAMHTGAPYRFRNLPWYYDYKALPADVRYAMEHEMYNPYKKLEKMALQRERMPKAADRLKR